MIRTGFGPGRVTERGFTVVELMCCVFLMVIMAGIALPVAHVMERRAAELELRRHLREMRNAIDAYYHVVEHVPSAQQKLDVSAGFWPEELEILVEGVDLGLAKDVKVKFLRRIPIDPITGEDEWGMRSSKQDADARTWDSVNVFDVYSLADGEALDGTEYREW
jgi:general secretion pathway protein G